MKLNKLTTLFAIGAALASGASYAAGDSAVINFTGTITASPCSVTTGTASQTVTIPSVTDVQLMNATSASSGFPEQAFSIVLEKCGSGINNALVSFSGTTDGQPFFLKNNGTATGMAVVVKDSTKANTVQFDGTSPLTFPITAFQDNTLNFYASMEGKKAGDAVGAGTVSATATATITYN